MPADDPPAPPASTGQERLWFLSRLDPETTMYASAYLVAVGGPLDVEALRRALRAVIDRHAPLRTTFSMRDGRPVQLVRERPPADLDVTELASCTDPEAEARRIGERLAAQPFDVEAGSLLRTCLLRLAPRHHHLVIVVHHLAFDAWSLDLLLGELSIIYAACAAGGRSPLPALHCRATDVVTGERARLPRGVIEEHLAYWRARLADGPPTLHLPDGQPRPGATAPRGALRPIAVPPPLARAMAALAASEDCPAVDVLVAAVALLLHRYTGQTDLGLVVPFSLRSEPAAKPLIGHLNGTLLLRCDLSGDPTGRELVRRVAVEARAGRAHDGLPFERLVEELRPEQLFSPAPIARVAVGLREGPSGRRRLGPLPIHVEELATGASRYDLQLDLGPAPAGLAGVVRYRSELFDAPAIDRLAGHLLRLLGGLTAVPDRRVRDLPILDEAEEHRVLFEWNTTAAPRTEPAAVHRVFESWADRTPDAVALRDGGAAVTYGELEASANRLAHALRRAGVGPDVPVGVAIDRSADAVLAFLGVLKSGGAYVPLDLSYPAQRLRLMVEDSQVRTIVARGDLSPALAAQVGRVVQADGLGEADLPATRPGGPDAGPDNLAYIVYTSGSTGRPKGVAVTHRGVVRLVTNQRYADLGPAQVLMLVAPVTFDAATFQVWGALLNGGSVVVLPASRDALGRLGPAVAGGGVSVLELTAGLFQVAVDQHLDDLTGVTQLLTGGDAVSLPHIASAFAGLPGCRIVHTYGPTEGTTFTTAHTVTAEDVAAGSVPIGRPIANTRTYVLDRWGLPVPAGVPGELHIAGDGLARGYVRQPGVTAERFLPDPFGAPGDRMYRSGDVVRLRADGELEFVGRTDRQVKVRGFRVEPGEVEAALALHEAVGSALAVVAGDAGGQRQVRAYAVPKPGRAVEEMDLRAFLRDRLPEHAVPAAIVVLDELPLTANGKVDRAALPPPRVVPAGAPDEWGGPTERVVVETWRSVLGVAAVGPDDNFFDLGGTSLLMMRVHHKLQELIDRSLSLVDLFDHPTAGELAAHLDGR